MKKTHSIHAAKTQLSRLIERAEGGEEVIIARRSTPVARLTRLEPKRPARRFGAMRGRAKVTRAFFAPLPSEEIERWG
jgi:prevent-host-death family protein